MQEKVIYSSDRFVVSTLEDTSQTKRIWVLKLVLVVKTFFLIYASLVPWCIRPKKKPLFLLPWLSYNQLLTNSPAQHGDHGKSPYCMQLGRSYPAVDLNSLVMMMVMMHLFTWFNTISKVKSFITIIRPLHSFWPHPREFTTALPGTVTKLTNSS